MKKPTDFSRRRFETRRQKKLDRNAARRARKRESARRIKHPVRGPHVPHRISSVLDYYADRIGLAGVARTGTQKVVFPPILSFIDNPEETLGVLDEMVAGSGWGTRELFLDHSKCTQLDHGAVSVVAALATQAQSRRILVNGRNPQDPVATDIIMAVGAPRLLRYIRGPIPENFLSFRLRRVQTHRRTSAGRSTPHERIVQQIETHLNKCVERFGFCLTDDSRRRLGGLLGEVCGNAEEHPGRPEWWASAYLQHQDDVYGTCYLTIFCLGETIYETLDGALPKGCFMRDRIGGLVRSHRARGLLGDTWTEGNLWTLYALQEGVHRANHGGDPGARGNGTVQLMKYFKALSGSAPPGRESRMCIISGDTQILFDGRYWPSERVVHGEKVTVMAFNDANDLHVPPDKANVMSLTKFFPGTLISLRFYLSADDLRRSDETDEIR